MICTILFRFHWFCGFTSLANGWGGPAHRPSLQMKSRGREPWLSSPMSRYGGKMVGDDKMNDWRHTNEQRNF